jgi:hypothetical protein
MRAIRAVVSALAIVAAFPAGSGAQVRPVPTPTPVVLPDLVIDGNIVGVKATCGSNGTVAVTAKVTVKNASPTAVDLSKIPWNIVVELDTLESGKGAVKAQQGGPKMLAGGQTYVATMTVTNIKPYMSGTPPAPWVYLKATADPLKAVQEANENNNQRTSNMGVLGMADQSCAVYKK